MPKYHSDSDSQRHRRRGSRDARRAARDRSREGHQVPRDTQERLLDHVSRSAHSSHRTRDGGYESIQNPDNHERSRRRERSRSRSSYRSRSRSNNDNMDNNTSNTSNTGNIRDKTKDKVREKLHSRSQSSRSRSPRHRRHRKRQRSDSPDRSHRRRRQESGSPAPPTARSRKPLPTQEDSFRGTGTDEGGGELIEKDKPNFVNTGLLARESNTVAGTSIVLKYNEPPEARKPPSSQPWRLFIFKGKEMVKDVILHTQSCWLVGREAAVADLNIEHPSSSKQHAVIQFRYITKVNEFGDRQGKVRPYIIDLDSSNGTILNGEKIDARRFLEIQSGDVVKFGLSEREYVFMLPPSE